MRECDELSSQGELRLLSEVTRAFANIVQLIIMPNTGFCDIQRGKRNKGTGPWERQDGRGLLRQHNSRHGHTTQGWLK